MKKGPEAVKEWVKSDGLDYMGENKKVNDNEGEQNRKE